MSLNVSKNPLRSKSTFSVVGGSRVDVVCATFVDRNLVIITQFKKLGTLVSVTPRYGQQCGKPSFKTAVLMGNDILQHHVYSRAVGEVVHKLSLSAAKDNSPAALQGKPLLCTLALSDPTPDHLTEVCKLVEECDVWSEL